MKVLVIGAGYIGQVHMSQYEKMPDVEIAGIVDSRPEASEVAKRFKTKFYTSIKDVNTDEFDVVDVDVPTIYHKEYAIWAADLGKNIICEKPLAREVRDAELIVERCREKHVKLLVGLVLRYYPEYRRAKKLVETGEIGTPCTATTHRGGAFPKGTMDWYADRSMSGGTVFDMVIHDFDFLRWTLGPVERVFCKQSDPKTDHVDYSITTMKFKSGAIADVHGFWTHGDFRTRFEIAGTDGLLVNDSTMNRLAYTTQPYSLNENTADPSYPEFWKYDPMYMEIRDFVDSIEKKKDAAVSENDALESVKMASAAELSAKTGRPVYMEEMSE